MGWTLEARVFQLLRAAWTPVPHASVSTAQLPREVKRTRRDFQADAAAPPRWDVSRVVDGVLQPTRVDEAALQALLASAPDRTAVRL